MIRIENLNKKFGKNKVLQGIDLTFDRSCITAVLGPNGSGKTTLIKCLLGMVIPTGGRVLIDGQDVRNQWAYRDRIDYLPQIARFPENLRVRELITMVRNLRKREPREQALIERFGLQPFLNHRLGHLSGGTLQKVNLVTSLMYDSPLVLLDEPTAGLDPVALISLKELIRQQREKGKIILITTHIMSFVEEMAEEIVFLLDGKVYFKGSGRELKETYGGDTVERAIANLLGSEKRQETGDKRQETREDRHKTSGIRSEVMKLIS